MKQLKLSKERQRMWDKVFSFYPNLQRPDTDLMHKTDALLKSFVHGGYRKAMTTIKETCSIHEVNTIYVTLYDLGMRIEQTEEYEMLNNITMAKMEIAKTTNPFVIEHVEEIIREAIN